MVVNWYIIVNDYSCQGACFLSYPDTRNKICRRSLLLV